MRLASCVRAVRQAAEARAAPALLTAAPAAFPRVARPGPAERRVPAAIRRPGALRTAVRPEPEDRREPVERPARAERWRLRLGAVGAHPCPSRGTSSTCPSDDLTQAVRDAARATLLPRTAYARRYDPADAHQQRHAARKAATVRPSSSTAAISRRRSHRRYRKRRDDCGSHDRERLHARHPRADDGHDGHPSHDHLQRAREGCARAGHQDQPERRRNTLSGRRPHRLLAHRAHERREAERAQQLLHGRRGRARLARVAHPRQRHRGFLLCERASEHGVHFLDRQPRYDRRAQPHHELCARRQVRPSAKRPSSSMAVALVFDNPCSGKTPVGHYGASSATTSSSRTTRRCFRAHRFRLRYRFRTSVRGNRRSQHHLRHDRPSSSAIGGASRTPPSP